MGLKIGSVFSYGLIFGHLPADFIFFSAYIKFLWPARGLILLSFAKIGSFCANSGLINLILALLYVGDGILVGKSRVIFMQKIQLNPNLGIHSIWIISLLSQVLGARESFGCLRV